MLTKTEKNRTGFCKDCRWMNIITNKCNSPKLRRPVIDMVSGIPKSRYCITQRIDGFILARLFGTCGAEGRFFEPK